MRWIPWLAVALYLCGLVYLSRGIQNEDWDGIKAVNNGLLVAKAAAPEIPLDLQRAPLGWLPLAPALAWAYGRGGPRLALATAHRLWPLYLGFLLLGSLSFFRELFSLPIAAVLTVLLAANPILIQFAPFALLDIFGGLSVLFFLWAGRRYAAAPGGRNWWILAAACAAAFLSKYHLGLLSVVPALFAARRRSRGPGTAALWLLPAACAAAAVVFLALLVFWVYAGGHASWREAWGELAANFSFNLLRPKQSRWPLYAEALWRQLGFGLLALMLWGVRLWWKSDGDEGSLLALTLVVPYAALCFAVANKEARYAIPLLPLVYAAVGRGLQDFLKRLPGPGERRAALVGCLLLVPWNACVASTRYLATEPSVHTAVPWTLAALAERRVAQDGCVGWVRGDLGFPIENPLFRYEPTLLVGAPTFKFFSRRRVVEAETAKDAAACGLVIVPRDGPQGRRWDGPALARVSGDGGRDWDVFSAELRPAP